MFFEFCGQIGWLKTCFKGLTISFALLVFVGWYTAAH